MPASQESLAEYGLTDVPLWTAWTQVNSSNVGAVRYNAVQRKLQVVFLSGSKYEFDGVEESTYDNFLGAPSKGKFFYYAIRQFDYPTRKI